MKTAPLRIVVVSCVIFFLTFLGMRISFLDKSSKPKPKPRAVLNLFAKSTSGTTFSTKASLAPALDAFDVTSPAPDIHRSSVIGRYTALHSSPVVSPDLLHPKGRSPPRC